MWLFSGIEKSFPDLEKLFDRESLRNLVHGSYADLDIHHLFLGAWIRDNLLNEDGALYALFRKGGVSNKEDMSMLLMQLFYIEMRIRSIDGADAQAPPNVHKLL